MTRSSVVGTPVATLVKLGAFALVAVLCLVLVGGALRNGGGDDRSTFDARFDDVSGLYAGDDVRLSGVLVGSVNDIELDGNRARVSFEVDSDRPVLTTTKAAVRYQNLLGQRYLELISTDDSGSELAPGSSLADDMTVPSFDITTLFDGFQPIFETIDTDQVNRFAQNVLDLVQGDGSGLGPVLRDLDGLTTYASQREDLIVLLIRNLGAISGVVAERSEQLGRLFAELDRVVSTFADRADTLLSSVDDINSGQGPFISIGEQLRDTYDSEYGPVDSAFRRLVPGAQQLVDLLAMVPSLLRGVDQTVRNAPEGQVSACSAGDTEIPGIGSVVLGTQRLVVCR
ncbi:MULTISPECIES: MCE family protein [unclassified Rhodococcus (in: high G+C Gram-positive bacteria)]|uniref:MCE family protein n=1 Tax=unclassified Rhodococcus (in: high G+C Gram-positive bacteria) TaxID=192944 RepID=UPI00254A91FC|nr:MULTISPECIES: MlaD family protein [unclassified Rhodococcus (in: high G+C Gram-positive bacteria)]MDQ1200037.1 phospholipid/cholesterol/gamma-HCH transport system substrate-binding protein [Rhodococcus sp. SORGH_AS_0303]